MTRRVLDASETEPLRYRTLAEFVAIDAALGKARPTARGMVRRLPGKGASLAEVLRWGGGTGAFRRATGGQFESALRARRCLRALVASAPPDLEALTASDAALAEVVRGVRNSKLEQASDAWRARCWSELRRCLRTFRGAHGLQWSGPSTAGHGKPPRRRVTVRLADVGRLLEVASVQERVVIALGLGAGLEPAQMLRLPVAAFRWDRERGEDGLWAGSIDVLDRSVGKAADRVGRKDAGAVQRALQRPHHRVPVPPWAADLIAGACHFQPAELALVRTDRDAPRATLDGFMRRLCLRAEMDAGAVTLADLRRTWQAVARAYRLPRGSIRGTFTRSPQKLGSERAAERVHAAESVLARRWRTLGDDDEISSWLHEPRPLPTRAPSRRSAHEPERKRKAVPPALPDTAMVGSGAVRAKQRAAASQAARPPRKPASKEKGRPGRRDRVS